MVVFFFPEEFFIPCTGDNLHEMSKPISEKNKKKCFKSLSAENFTSMLSVNHALHEISKHLSNSCSWKKNQSTDSTGGSIVSECRLGKWS